jgi:hypothetical protein
MQSSNNYTKKLANNKYTLEQRLQARMDAVYNSMLSILQNDPMGYQYENFAESGFILLSTTCGVVDYDHYINCDLDGGEVADNNPEWTELYKEYQNITLEADQLNACLVFGRR